MKDADHAAGVTDVGEDERERAGERYKDATAPITHLNFSIS